MKMIAFKCDLCGALYEGNDKRGVADSILCGDLDIVIKKVMKGDKEVDVCGGCIVKKMVDTFGK